MIREETPNRFISAWENDCTLANTSLRMSRVTAVEIFAQQYPSRIVPHTPMSEITAITAPLCSRYPLSCRSTPSSIMFETIVGMPSSTSANPNTDKMLSSTSHL